MSGTNSVLFDFYSLVDKKLSVIKYIAGEYRDAALNHFDKDRILYTPNDTWIFDRLYNPEDVFRSIISDVSKKDSYEKIMEMIINRDEGNIWKKYAFQTSLNRLITAYAKAGNGVIKTAVQCENELQKEYIQKLYQDTPIELGSRENIDMEKYGRLIVGDYKDALKYKLEGPKSILVLNFRENFTPGDITQLNPELIISLGDIHDIEVVSAYTNEFDIKG